MKKRTLLWLVLALVVFGGGAWMAQKTNLFGGITLSPRAKQLAYLKEHEEEMANFIKSRNPKVESVQFDWDSMKVENIGINENNFDPVFKNVILDATSIADHYKPDDEYDGEQTERDALCHGENRKIGGHGKQHNSDNECHDHRADC